MEDVGTSLDCRDEVKEGQYGGFLEASMGLALNVLTFTSSKSEGERDAIQLRDGDTISRDTCRCRRSRASWRNG